MNSHASFGQQNYPIFFEYHNYCANVPALNYVEYVTSSDVEFFAAITEKQSSFCEVCNQQFRTPVIYNRHMRSRKHALKCIRTKMDKSRCRTNERLTLLPNEVIDSLISDLEGNLDEKDTFFGDIDLGKRSDTTEDGHHLPSFKVFTAAGDSDGESASVSSTPYPQFSRYGPNVPKIYPCSLCFRTLHSQELFDQHLQERHFRDCEPIRHDWFSFVLFE